MLRTLALALLTVVLAGPAAASEPSSFSVEKGLAYGSATRQRGDLYRPDAGGLRPAVLVIHGGSWTRGSRTRMKNWAERFAGAGYVVFNIDYRLAPESTHPAQRDDARAAFEWLRNRAGRLSVDPDRIGAMGYSSGGHLALLLALEDDAGPRPAAVASGAAPTDLLAYPDNPVLRGFLGTGPERREVWVSASPLEHAGAGDPPVLLFHGALDSVVGIDHSRRLHARLEKHGVTTELVEQPFTGHMTAYVFDRSAFESALAFFEAHLR